MLGGEYGKSKVYASCLEVLRKLATCSLWFRGLNNKNTLCGSIEGSKTRNNLQRRYLEVTKQEAAFESRQSSLKHNKQCTRDVFRE